MKKLLIVILGLWSVAYGQTTQQFRYDTTKFLKVGGRNHVMIENLAPVYDSTAKALVVGADGVIKRIAYWPSAGGGGGASRYVTPQYGMISDSTTTPGLYRLSVDTTSSTGLVSKDRLTAALATKIGILTTIGTSGPATKVGDSLNIPNYAGGGYTPTNNRSVVFTNGGALKDTTVFTYSGGFLGLNLSAPSSLLHLQNNNIGVANNYDKGIMLENTTTATASLLQQPPPVAFKNHYYRGADQTQTANIYGLSESGGDVYGGIGMAVDGTNIFNFRRRISGSNIAAFGWNLELTSTIATWTSPNGGTTFQNAASIFTSAASRHVVGIKAGANTTPAASAILDVESTTKGILFPRMTQAQRTAIGSPAVGLIVYQTDGTEGVYINKSGGWAFAF